MKACPKCGRENADHAWLCDCGYEFDDDKVTKESAAVPVGKTDPPAPVLDAQVCPKCGSTSGFHEVEIQSDGTSAMLLLFGGVLESVAYDLDRRNKIQCDACRYIFIRRSPMDI